MRLSKDGYIFVQLLIMYEWLYMIRNSSDNDIAESVRYYTNLYGEL